jgi:outer membrane protein TolC
VAFERYYALAPAVSLAKESLRLNTLSYQNGVARTVDVTDAYITLAGVQLAEYKALYDYNSALFQLNKLVGLGLSSTQEYSNL